MASYNRVVLVGNLTRDPDYRQLSSGQAVCKIGLATNRQYKNRQTGAVVQEVCYIDVDVWGAQAESCRQYLQKGRGVLVEGRLKLDSWDDANGQSRSKHSIVADRVVFLGSNAPASENVDVDAADMPRGATLSDAAGISSREQQKTEANLLSQITEIKKRATVKKSPESNSGASDFSFQDQPPFEDELPF